MAHGEPIPHATEFAQKIKSRFDLDTYKQLIDILQKGDDVYAQVETLFHGAHDVMAEFKLFLPVKRKSPTPYRPKRPKLAAESTFFEDVKTYIGNQQTYFQFLRTLNLFTQQVLDANSLVQQCESYLRGNKELYDQLKALVGYEETARKIEAVDILVECGPSYRSVPISVSLVLSTRSFFINTLIL